MQSKKTILSLTAAMGALLTMGLLVADAAPAAAASRFVQRYNRAYHRNSRRGRIYRHAQPPPAAQ